MNLQGFRVESGSVRKPNLPGLGSETVVVSKIDAYGLVRKPNLPGLGVKIRSKNGELNSSV